MLWKHRSPKSQIVTLRYPDGYFSRRKVTYYCYSAQNTENVEYSEEPAPFEVFFHSPMVFVEISWLLFHIFELVPLRMTQSKGDNRMAENSARTVVGELS